MKVPTTARGGLLRSLAENRTPWAVPWPCLYEFVAVVTHARIFDPPTPLDLACRIALLGRRRAAEPRLARVTPPPRPGVAA